MRYFVIEMIVSNPPVMPACFDSPDQWESWLATAHQSGVRIVRRVDIVREGRRTTHFEVLPLNQIDYCSDCTAIRRARMLGEGRCAPSSVGRPPDLAVPAASIPEAQASPQEKAP